MQMPPAGKKTGQVCAIQQASPAAHWDAPGAWKGKQIGCPPGKAADGRDRMACPCMCCGTPPLPPGIPAAPWDPS